MLKGRNVVIVKGDKDSPSLIHEYDRVYLEYGTGDPVEDFGKTSEGKELAIDGKVWQGVRPKNAVSTVPVETLMSEALAYYAAEYPKANPYITLLEASSYGNDLWKRNQIQADIRPAKPIDKQAAIQKMVKLLMAMNPKLTLVKATAAATAATEAQSDDQAA